VIVRATSDLHLTQANSAFVFAALAQLREDAEAHGGVTLILGDVLDQPEQVHMPTWNRLRRLCQGWPGRLIVLAGNHDQYDRPNAAVEGLAGASCRVVTEPEWIPGVGSVLPYVPEGEWSAALARLGLHSTPHVWCHAGFRGAYLNNMRRDTNGVPGAAVGDRYVITGHYHMPQTLGRVIYTGSPFEHTFAEEGQDKGWLRWSDIGVEPMPERVRFADTGAPRHVTVHWDLDRETVSSPDLRSGDKVRVRTKATATAAKAAAKQLIDRGLEGVPVLARPDAASSRGVVRAGMTREEQVEAYLASADADGRLGPDPREMLEWAEAEQLFVSP
jgi:hypothetical protein